MPSASEAQAAITGLNGKEFMGRALNVNNVLVKEAAAQSVAPVEVEVVGEDPGAGDTDRHHARVSSYRCQVSYNRRRGSAGRKQAPIPGKVRAPLM